MLKISEFRHAAIKHFAPFFNHEHLSREDLRAVSERFTNLAQGLVDTLPDGPELAVALRKLLEAKDAAVRAAL